MNVYVVWADIYAQISGSISDGNDAMKISPPARVWPPSLGGGSLLGTLDHDANNALTYRYAIGKIQISAFLTPSQASAVIDRTKWDIKRTVTAAAWDNGGHYVNGEWQQGPSLSVANMDDTSPAVWKDVDPLSGTSTGQLYDLDAAGCSVALPGTTINHTSEIYVNFTQWATVTLDTSYKVSDNVIWSWQAQVDGDKPAGSRVELNQLSTQAINIPGAPHYAQR